MEILNNIWMALSTPNEGLANIIVSIGIIFESFLLTTLFLTILEISSTKKQQLICMFFMSCISILDMYILPSPFNTLLNYFTMIIIACIIYKTSLLKSTIGIVISGVIFIIVGSLVLNPYLRMFHITTVELSLIPIYRLIYLIIIYLFTFLICLILKIKKLRLNIIENTDKNTKRIIIANVIFGILTILIQTIIMFYYMNNLPILISFLSFISSLAFFCMSIYSLTRAFKLISTTQKLQSAEEYNHTLHILHDNVRGFKHDFDNIVTTIGGYIRTEDMEGLKNYYLQLEDDCQRVNNLYILNPDIINNDGIYNLLTKKYNEADSKDIKMNITFLLDLSTLKMKIYEFARILGILLDNAIEASSECEEKIINLTFRNDVKNSRQLVIIENTYKNKDIDTEKIFEKGISEKENHTGLGLWEVRKIIKKNNNINLYTSKNDTLFSQQLEIYY